MIRIVNNIFLIIVVSRGVFSHKHEERHEASKDYDGPYLMFDVLQSLLKLNEARFATLKKLNNLNNVQYLRTPTENTINLTKHLNKLKPIFQMLTVKPSVDKNDVKYYDIFFDNNYLLTIPSKSDGNNVLRTQSREHINDENVDDIIPDDIDDDYESYECGRGRLRCFLACKEAYIKSCASGPCKYGFLVEMRRTCKEECQDRFY